MPRRPSLLIAAPLAKSSKTKKAACSLNPPASSKSKKPQPACSATKPLLKILEILPTNESKKNSPPTKWSTPCSTFTKILCASKKDKAPGEFSLRDGASSAQVNCFPFFQR